jgi:hypothetical protein
LKGCVIRKASASERGNVLIVDDLRTYSARVGRDRRWWLLGGRFLWLNVLLWRLLLPTTWVSRIFAAKGHANLHSSIAPDVYGRHYAGERPFAPMKSLGLALVSDAEQT